MVKESADVVHAANEAGWRWVDEARPFCVDACEVEYGTTLEKDFKE